MTQTHINKERFTYLELKSIIIGFIKWIEDSEQEVNIPEYYFTDIDKSKEFWYEFYEDEYGEDVRCFTLFGTQQKVLGKDFKQNKEQTTKIDKNQSHLKLVASNGELV